jgi:hypothetical protein
VEVAVRALGQAAGTKVGEVLWFGMLSVWDTAAQQHHHVERFAYVYTPVTQTTVNMGGVKAFTAVFAQSDGDASRHPVSLDRIEGPLRMLVPNPQNQHGHADTYRFFSTPGKRGLL